MAPTVRKAKTAFLYYQSDQLSKIRAQLGPAATMGAAMTELSKRWRSLSEDERTVYKDQEAADRERFDRESREADEAAIAAQEARRQALTVQEGESHSSRGARGYVDQRRAAKEESRRKRKEAAALNYDSEEEEARAAAAAAKKRETKERRRKRQEEEQAVQKQHNKIDKEEAKRTTKRLEYLLGQSSIFSKLHGVGNKEKDKEKKSRKEDDKKRNKSSKPRSKTPPPGVHHIHREESNESSSEDEDENESHVFLTQQPSVIKHGKLKPYQLESLNWMIHLAEKGLNGILADEMGLGKTLQSISIMAYHYEYMGIQGPYLVCVPKSTLSNWLKEFKRWAPCFRTIKFHGSREEREYMIDNFFTNEAAAHDGKRPTNQIMDETGELVDDNTMNPRTWDVCITTYEIANTERKTLQKFAWKYLVIDEAHRLKNDASMFSKTVRSFRTANRLLLTGTPLQNNLHELWALLNFLLPDIFSSAEQFDEWFDLEIDDEEAKKNIISQLHKILRPFMLRRLKADVAKGLPPKTETILMVGMSKMQKQLYRKLLLRDLDSITGKVSGKNRTAVLNIVMQLRKCCGHPYLFEGVEDRTLDPLGEHLIENCGKLSMVDKLLKRLKERGNRVLIFTQMTRVLDIIEDFMVMRGYKYYRIDGNTPHEDREASIDNFNAPGSEAFCFILSTRAGGLGINLQTADTCILYDSDWNPQQDLQAQDRCHRLGQKKPVNIFRLVSENTVEEKIVERAQQKLKLDAMVVQQGRLKEKDKVSKEEIMAAVRFGADTVFRSEESTITDDDIDVILERGAAKTKELTEKIQKAEKGDLLDFSLDGGVSAQTFEGVDYSDKQLRDHLRMLAANSIGKRERRPPPTSYNPIIISKKSMVVNNHKIKLPKSLRIPQMEDHHFYNRERLLEIGNLEFETYAALREADQLPSREVMDEQGSLLTPELAQEKRELLAEGFGDWSRSQYFAFTKACAKFGREDITRIAAEMDMSEEAVAPYSEAFWRYGPTELKGEWERVIGNIERGEKKLAKQKKLSALLGQFVGTFEDPRNNMVFANKGTTHFAQEQDRALMCAVDKREYGNWEAVREDIRNDTRLKFQHTVQGMTVQAINKRCDYRMRQMEKELEARDKVLKNKRPPNVVAAHKAIEAIKETDFWDMQAREAQLAGETPELLEETLHGDARLIMEERMKDRNAGIARLREIEVQVQRCKGLAEDTRQCIMRGDQYVNYSNITLKAGGPAAAGKDDTTGQSLQDGVDLEAQINPTILKIPPCRQCDPCKSSDMPRRLCLKRLEARNELISNALSKYKGSDKKKMKKYNGQSSYSSPSNNMTSSSLSASSSSSPKYSSSAPPIKKKKNLMMKKPDGQLKPRVTSQGNKRMTIPDELFPEFCRRISAAGTGERMKLINEFVEDHPTISVRQVTLKLSEVTTRDRPACVAPPSETTKKSGRAFIFYLRPCFYKHLPPEDRPPNWKEFAEADEKLMAAEKKNNDNNKNTTTSNGNASKPSTQDSGPTKRGPMNGSGEDGESESGEPAKKKAKNTDSVLITSTSG